MPGAAASGRRSPRCTSTATSSARSALAAIIAAVSRVSRTIVVGAAPPAGGGGSAVGRDQAVWLERSEATAELVERECEQAPGQPRTAHPPEDAREDERHAERHEQREGDLDADEDQPDEHQQHAEADLAIGRRVRGSGLGASAGGVVQLPLRVSPTACGEPGCGILDERRGHRKRHRRRVLHRFRTRDRRVRALVTQRYAAAMVTEPDASSSVTVEAGEPDFIEAFLEWQDTVLEPARARGERKDPFETGSGIPVAPLYTPADLTAHDPLRHEGFPGVPPFTRGIQPTMYRGPALEHPPVRGLRHRGRRQRALPLPARPGSAGALGRLRPPDPDGPGQRRSAQRRRGGSGGRRHRLGARHGGSVRGHPAQRGEHLDDHQRAGAGAGRDVRRRRGASGSRRGVDHGDRPERRAQGVRRSRHVHLSAAAVAAPRRGSDRLVHRQRAEVQPDLAVRVSHPRGGKHRGAGDGVRHRQRVRVRAGVDRSRCRRRRLRAQALVDLQHAHRFLRGDRQVPGAAAHVVADHGANALARAIRAR